MCDQSSYFDVVVVGGGHAGAEAAWAASRLLGDRGTVAMITMDPAAIGRMSCNPAIGGLAKGQMVREIDALGGLMAHAIDATGIQFRLLNASKGPAVQSPRAQADKYRYARIVQHLLMENCPNLAIIADIAEDILVDPARHGDGPVYSVRGLVLKSGRQLTCRCAVLTTGTFLRGLMHTGEKKTQGGRVGEQAAVGLSGALIKLGFELQRLKTGTPPRVARESINFSNLEPQYGDNPPRPFSDLSTTEDSPLGVQFPSLTQVPCHITYTNPTVHEFIRANLHRAPMYSGQIQSRGPRYCPSIEDKVVRFADKSQHQIFLEPESLDTNEIYCNGIATSLPVDVQEQVVHHIAGLEKAVILRYGYAIEYDFAPPYQVGYSLETHRVTGLFFAGQLNGTSGYEEAAGQGLIAGINAAMKIRGDTSFTLRRDQAYIGVMIDDLITKVPTEPYRMFTSRAEYRLTLRSDNTDQRLTPLAAQIGLAEPGRIRRLENKLAAMQRLQYELQTLRIPGGGTAMDLLRRPDLELSALSTMLGEDGPRFTNLLADISTRAYIEQIQIEARYAGYILREKHAAERMVELEDKLLPAGLNFKGITELRTEARQALEKFRPRTIGQASRLEGITPADLMVLTLHLGSRRQNPKAVDNKITADDSG
ncbi:MAG: tRNA uridine-5-carboxymethylaminomethyl(34) synthesis enzyme MnmG [Planctomycetes bacterium]|nr:tRNA uridine-5-carboxymethylaminomethyl(34) synthesis enzyme MnmG [Planctomycetota bacterium]